MRLIEGTLWQNVLQVTERALSDGSLHPIHTEYELIEECGIRFVIRIVSSLKLKAETKKKQDLLFEPGNQPESKVSPDLHILVSQSIDDDVRH